MPPRIASREDHAAMKRRSSAFWGVLALGMGLVAAPSLVAPAEPGGVPRKPREQLARQHAPATSTPLPPAEAQKRFSVPAGFEVRLFAAEPQLANPVAMTWDDRGRLWVLELLQYPFKAKPGERGRDRIKILEDVDNDGRADKVTIF